MAKFCLAIGVEYGISVYIHLVQLFRFEELHFTDTVFFRQTDDGVEEVDEKVFVGFRVEKTVYAEDCERIDLAIRKKRRVPDLSLLVLGSL